MKMIKFILILVNILPAFAYNNMTIDDIIDANSPSLQKLNPIAYFNDLLNIPDSLIQDIISLENLKPPTKLQTPTKVQAPPSAQIGRHWNHAKLSGCLISEVVGFKCAIGCTDYKISKVFQNARYGSLAMIGFEPTTNEIIIAHRSTSNIQNWMRNLSYSKVKMPNTPEDVLVHEGFLGVYNSNADNLNTYLMDMLNDPKFKGYKVVFVGHSLGGAVATLHAVDMATKVKAMGFPVELYAYHSPRVGNQGFVDYTVGLKFPIARFTNKGDFANHFGPRQLGYIHVPGEFHTDSSDLLGWSFRKCSQDYDEDPNCGWKELKNIRSWDHLFGFGSIATHFC